MTKEQKEELVEAVQALYDLGYSKEEILDEFARQVRLAEEAEREAALLVKRQPPAVKAGNMDV